MGERDRSSSEASASNASVTAAVVFYCICSGSMLIVNKLAVVHLPLPALLTVCQFASASSFVYACKLLGILEMDDFEWDKAKYFALYVLAFALGTWTNMKVLATANVETVIVFRSCCPIVVAGFDYIFYRRAFPAPRSLFSLLLITGGAVGYIMSDREFQSKGWVAYYWVMIWWVVLIFQLTYGKFLVRLRPRRHSRAPARRRCSHACGPRGGAGVGHPDQEPMDSRALHEHLLRPPRDAARHRRRRARPDLARSRP